MNSTLTYLQNALNIFIMYHLGGYPSEAGPSFLMYAFSGQHLWGLLVVVFLTILQD